MTDLQRAAKDSYLMWMSYKPEVRKQFELFDDAIGRLMEIVQRECPSPPPFEDDHSEE